MIVMTLMMKMTMIVIKKVQTITITANIPNNVLTILKTLPLQKIKQNTFISTVSPNLIKKKQIRKLDECIHVPLCFGMHVR